MVANMMHSVNPLLDEVITITRESDVEVALRRPSWIRNVASWPMTNRWAWQRWH
jgi:hypothetical protein